MTIDELNEVVDRCNCKDMDDLIKLMDKYGFSHEVIDPSAYESIVKDDIEYAYRHYSTNNFIEYVGSIQKPNDYVYFMRDIEYFYDRIYIGVTPKGYKGLVRRFREYLVEFCDFEEKERTENVKEPYTAYRERKQQEKLSMIERMKGMI